MNSPEKPALADTEFFSRAVDGHLVMNVLNQLAARSYLQSGKECPQIFALSDYLCEALQQTGDYHNTLPQDTRLLTLHLQLLATLHRYELELNITVDPGNVHRIQKGCLYILSQCLLRAAAPPYGGKWKMLVTLRNDLKLPQTLQAVFELQGMSHDQNLSLANASRNLYNAVADKLVNVASEAKVTQDTLDHLRLIACIPVQE